MQFLGLLAASGAPLKTLDSRAMALLRKNRDAMFEPKSFRAECVTVRHPLHPTSKSQFHYELAVLAVAKPNLMRYDCWRLHKAPNSKPPHASPELTFVSDGHRQWQQYGTSYRQVDNADPAELGTILEPWTGFFAVKNSMYGEVLEFLRMGHHLEIKALRPEIVEGVRCDKIEVHDRYVYSDHPVEEWKTVYLRPDGLVRRRSERYVSGDRGFLSTADLRRIEKNPDLRKVRYAYVPPKGVTLEGDRKQTPPLADGKVAPDFTAQGRDGSTIHLSDFRGKVVVLDFWASWCGPCLTSMPHTQSVAAKFEKEDSPVVLLAVDDGESLPAFADWTKANSAKYPAIVYAHSATEISGKLYGVTGIPTQFVIDAKGILRRLRRPDGRS